MSQIYPVDRPETAKSCYVDEDTGAIICELKMKSGREVRWPLEDILTQAFTHKHKVTLKDGETLFTGQPRGSDITVAELGE